MMNASNDPPPDSEPSSDRIRNSSYESPEMIADQQRQSHRLLLLVIRLLFIVMLVTTTALTVASIQSNNPTYEFVDFLAVILAAIIVAVLVLVVDAMTPNKRVSSVFAIYLGICAGLIGALAVGALVDGVAKAWEFDQGPAHHYVGLIKIAIGIILCYLAVSIVLTTKDDFRLIIPYVEFAKQVRGVRPLLLDTSALIDGRIDALGRTGIVDAPLIVPQFVLNELQTLADSGDKLKRARGRRGLDLVRKLQTNPYVIVSIDTSSADGVGVDRALIHLAADQNMRIVTTDFNLNKVAQIEGITVLNLNDLASTIRPQIAPGDSLDIEIVKEGESATQGIGYLPDGTMVVVENAANRVGDTLEATVTNSLQTAAGRMIFAKHENDADNGNATSMSRAATQQPRTPIRSTEQSPQPSTRRNPRR